MLRSYEVGASGIIKRLTVTIDLEGPSVALLDDLGVQLISTP